MGLRKPKQSLSSSEQKNCLGIESGAGGCPAERYCGWLITGQQLDEIYKKLYKATE